MIDDIWQMTIIGRIQGQTVENVLHYKVSADADVSAFRQGLFNFASATLIPAITNVQSNTFTWTGVRTQKIWPLPALVANEDIIAIPGGNVAAATPCEVAFVVKKQTIIAGRAFRGRCYFSGITNTYLDQATGLWNATLNADAALIEPALVASVNSDPIGGILQAVLYHRTTHTGTYLSSARSTVVPRVQRRRQIGRGI